MYISIHSFTLFLSVSSLHTNYEVQVSAISPPPPPRAAPACWPRAAPSARGTTPSAGPCSPRGRSCSQRRSPRPPRSPAWPLATTVSQPRASGASNEGSR